MNRIFTVVLVVIELFIFLCACGGAQTPPSPPAAAPSSSSAEEMPSAALCMSVVNHPTHRLVQLGFLETAEELGYEGRVLGLAEGTAQQVHDEWLRGAKEYGISGAAFWGGGDAGYETIKELHGMGVKTVAMHSLHDYWTTKDFIDVTAHSDWRQAVLDAGEYLMNCLREDGVLSGSIGISLTGPGPTFEEIHSLYTYFETYYPEYDILDCVYPGSGQAVAEKAVTEYIASHPDMVGALGMTGNSAPAWARAKSETGREDIVVVATSFMPENLDALASGGVDALLGQSLYEAGSVGLELIDSLLQGAVYQEEEEQWHCELDIRIVTKDGQGQNGAAYYNAMYARSAARFGS